MTPTPFFPGPARLCRSHAMDTRLTSGILMPLQLLLALSPAESDVEHASHAEA